MFQLTRDELDGLKIFIEESNLTMSSQFVMTYPNNRPARALPYAFTEEGIAMLSGVLNSDKAINMHIAIMRAFAAIRKIVVKQNDLTEQMKAIKKQIGVHDAQLNQIYEAIENLLDAKAADRKWNERERIGCKK